MKTRSAEYPPFALPMLGTAILLTLAFIAMPFVEGMVWTPRDFVAAGILLMGGGIAAQVAMRRATNRTYRIAAAMGVGASLFLAWVTMGVSIIGADGDPVNAVYFGVLAIGIAGAILARFRARGMSRTLVAMAIAQALIGVVAVLMWVGAAFSPPAEILGLTGLFVALFLCSAWLFRKAADQEGRTGATNR